MPNKLRRYYGAGYLHFITTSCYRRMPLLATPQHRDLLLEVVERVRRRYRFGVVGYVIMPEHVHLLIGEPERGDPSKVMQAIKQLCPAASAQAARGQRSAAGHAMEHGFGGRAHLAGALL